LSASAAPRLAPKLRPRRIALVALVITAIIYTRLPVAFFPVWIVLFVFARHRRTGLLLALGATAACGLVLVGLELESKGWYWMYTVSLYQVQHVLLPRFVLGAEVLLKWAPFAAGVPLVAGLLAWRRRLSARAALWVGMFVASIPSGLLPFA